MTAEHKPKFQLFLAQKLLSFEAPIYQEGYPYGQLQ